MLVGKKTDGVAGSTSGGDLDGVFTRILRLFSGAAACEPARPCKPRIYGPGNLEDEDIELGFADGTDHYAMVSELLREIRSCCQRAKISGFCFGLLDPHSNAILNAFIDMAVPAATDDAAQQEDGGGNTWQSSDDDLDMDQRSLSGLLAFLAGLFPHLGDAQAVWYLHKAKADPLVAARVIVKHRRMDRTFGFSSDATAAAVETALRCAAAAAGHPKPKRFLAGWRILSPSLEKLAALLLPPADLAASVPIMESLLLEEPHPPAFVLRGAWGLASSRLVALSPDLSRVAFPGRTTMRRLLLAAIHGYYLQALARLPRDQPCSQRLLYSMLRYGHCFGPLDPVSNILLNTVWYSAACSLPPSTENAEMDMISTRAMLRIAVRSFHGLVSFLCTRYDTLTVDQAMHDLLQAGADLRIADPNLHGGAAAAAATGGRVPSASVDDAYAAAAVAALHPKPDAHAQLLRKSTMILLMGAVYLKGTGQLSREVVCRLSSSAAAPSMRSQDQLLPETNVMDKLTYMRVDQHRNNFWSQHDRVVAMVKYAMDVYNSHHLPGGVPKYQLHVICGVNEHVHGPQYITGDKRMYHHSHINFLTTQSAAALPVLFFAQWSNHGTKDEECFCCPVTVPPLNSEQVRCLYCEYEGSRIVHPENQSFHGRDIEFEKMLCGAFDSGNYTNNNIIEHSSSSTFWVDGLPDDSIYSISRIDDDGEDKEDGPLSPKSLHRLIRLR